MEQKSIDQINDTFQSLQKEAKRKFQEIYEDMRKQLKKSNCQELGGELVQLEVERLNILVMSLMEGIKQEAIKEMLANGCQTYLTETGWTEIQQMVRIPKLETCKVKVKVVRNDGTKKEISKFEEDITQYEINKKKCIGIAAAGVAIVIVTLIIPAWEIPVMLVTGGTGVELVTTWEVLKMFAAGIETATLAKIPVIVTNGIGIVATFFGIGGSIYNEEQRKQVVSKFASAEEDSQKRDNKADLDNLISKIINSQCEHNLKIYTEWLNKVEEALIKECEKFIEMR